MQILEMCKQGFRSNCSCSPVSNSCFQDQAIISAAQIEVRWKHHTFSHFNEYSLSEFDQPFLLTFLKKWSLTGVPNRPLRCWDKFEFNWYIYFQNSINLFYSAKEDLSRPADQREAQVMIDPKIFCNEKIHAIFVGFIKTINACI